MGPALWVYLALSPISPPPSLCARLSPPSSFASPSVCLSLPSPLASHPLSLHSPSLSLALGKWIQ